MGVGPSTTQPKNLILYIHGLSAPSRAVWMTAKAADIPVTVRYLDLFKGEHKTAEFAKVSRRMGWGGSRDKSWKSLYAWKQVLDQLTARKKNLHLTVLIFVVILTKILEHPSKFNATYL